MKRIPIFCGFLDALLIFLVALLIKLADGIPISTILVRDARFFWPYVLPVCVLAGWRGRVHSARLIGGNQDWNAPILEGFAWGFLAGFLVMTDVIVRDVFAAGPAFDKPESISSWLWLVGTVIVTSSFCGFVGGIIAGILSVVNRLVVRWAI